MKTNLLKTIFTIFILSFTQSINSFPGDHNSLSCVDRLYVASDTEYASADKLKDALASSDSATVQKAREYVKRNTNAIKQKIRDHHDFGTDITKWGDSLSDWVDWYGSVPADHFGFPVLQDYGNEPAIIDSWGDYFTIFGKAFDDPFIVRNYATAGEQTKGLLDRVSTTPALIDGIWDVLPDQSHCIKEIPAGVGRGEMMVDPSSPRSVLMIGGNDVMQNFALFPFLNAYKVDEILENIMLITDWNIENGKKILLEGTLPASSYPVVSPYNYFIVNRKSICRPMEDSMIDYDEIPWYLCAFFPGGCVAMAQAVATANLEIFKAFNEFRIAIFSGSYIKYNEVKKAELGDVLMNTSSINQACINDRIAENIGPAYKNAYPNNVDYLPLYSSFVQTGEAVSVPNFWVPNSNIFPKYPDYNDEFIDTIHVGPNGYRIWGALIGDKLVKLGWNKATNASEMPEPVIELEKGGPLTKIRKKAQEVRLFGKESGGVESVGIENAPPNSARRYGGMYQKYTNDDRIYIQQIQNDLPEISIKEKWGEAYHLHGLLLTKYLEIDGMKELGFPMSDVLNVGPAGTLKRIYFECGYMTHNTLDLSNTENYSIQGNEACPVLNDNNTSFTNCLTEGECVGRWFEDYVFQLRPTGGHSPFKWEMIENIGGFPGILDRAGRLRGGPTNDPQGHWTIKIRMTDAAGNPVTKDVHVSTGW